MSLMLKLLAITLLLSNLVQADSSNKAIKDFFIKNIKKNPDIKSIDIKITKTLNIKGQKKWKAYFLTLDAVQKNNTPVSKSMLWFSDGKLISQDIFDLKQGANLQDLVAMPFDDKFYLKENLIYGNVNAKHKVVIFSDPLCPFCRKFVPDAIKYMKDKPNKFAIYYYHFPLPGLHPASVVLVKAARALEIKGEKDVVLRLYNVTVNPREKSEKKILEAFNEEMHSNITIQEMNEQKVSKHIQNDLKIAEKMIVRGTPTMFFDSKLDKAKNKYKTAK